MVDKVQIFVTGGTFDKEYNFVNGQLFFKDTHLPEMLERGRCRLSYDIKTLMMVDSLDMTDSDREIIAHNCSRIKADKVIITHGTDTMVETAKAIASQNLSDKTIVLTGALVPYAFGTSSDGFFNLGAALAYVQILPPGVYIAMNGQYFLWNNVRKNKQTGNFEALHPATL
jgi:L-asparaginase